MPPAVIGGVIAGVGAIGASVIGSKAQSKAVGQASDAQAAASKEATQLQRDVYNQNVKYQTPYLNTGNAAMAQYNALLGLNVPQTPVAAPLPSPANTNTPPPATSGGSNGIGPFFRNKIAATWQQRINSGQATFEDAPLFVRGLLDHQQAQTPANQTPATPTVPAVTQPTAQAAYDQFKNYTGYQSRLNEANNSLNSAYAAKGTLQSGAALQSLARMNQDYASGEFANYMNLLGGQQQVGIGAANALSGVGTNYANAAGQIAMQQGNNAANAAIARGNNTANMWSGIAGGLGTGLGSIFGSSYGGR